MAGINPATGRFDPYYYAPASSPGILPQTVQQKNGTMWNTYYNVASPGGSWSGAASAPAAASPAAAPAAPAGPTNTAPDWYTQWQADRAADLARNRSNAFDTLNSLFTGLGLDLNAGGLASQIWSWVQADKPSDWIRVEIRKTDAYRQRFPGMEALIKRGQFMDEATYIEQERQYRQVLKSFDLPEGFYDRPDDFSKFIVNQVSVKELSDRVTSAKTFLDTNSSPEYKAALQEMYGVTEGGMLAYVLDGDRATPLIQKQIKAAAIAGSTAAAGFGDLSTGQAERYGATLGAQYDAFGTDAKNMLETQMAQLGVQAANDERLASIDQEAFTRSDILDAALLNDTTKQLASKRRGEREAARFSGSSAIAAGTLSRTV